jgi:hypothetical protein
MATQKHGSSTYSTHEGASTPFDQLTSPGAYVCNYSGTLFRVPDDALAPGRSPVIEIVSKTPMMLTKLCDDPWVPISKARQVASDWDLYVNF